MKETFVLTRDCRFDGQHVKAGTKVTLDLENEIDHTKARHLAASDLLDPPYKPPTSAAEKKVVKPEPPETKKP